MPGLLVGDARSMGGTVALPSLQLVDGTLMGAVWGLLTAPVTSPWDVCVLGVRNQYLYPGLFREHRNTAEFPHAWQPCLRWQ